MRFIVHTSRSEAVCTASGGKMISYVHNEIPYLYSGDGTDRSEHLPVCFPAVPEEGDTSAHTEDFGSVSENGLISDQSFQPILLKPEKVSFSLENNAETKTQFPCRFRVNHTYTVNDNGFSAKFIVNNRDTKPMKYYLGTDPVFSLPLPENASASEYCLKIAAVDAKGETDSQLTERGKDVLCLDGTKDNIIRLADISAEFTTVAVGGPVEKQIRLFSEKTGHGIQIDPVGFRSLAVQLYKGESCICLKLFNYIPALSDELTAEKQRNPEPTVPAGGEYTVGYVVTIL